MEDQLISFETAKLAKEKEFCWENNDKLYYNSNGCLNILNFSEEDIPAPTQSILQKWLREVHKIYVNSEHDLTPDGKNILYFSNWGFINDPNSDNYKYNPNGGYDEKAIWKTYEEALEAGLQEALKEVHRLIPQSE